MQYIKPNPDPKPGANYFFEYQNYPKISLTKGKEEFLDCINMLKNMTPVQPLQDNPFLYLNVPTISENWVKKQIINSMILAKKEEIITKVNKLQFHYDIAGINPVLTVMHQIIDDNITFNHTRRKNILDEDFNSIGISNYNIGKKVCVYLLFVNFKF